MEELAVVFPELALGVGAGGRLRRGARLRVERKRVIAVHEPDLVAVGAHHLLHDVLGALAI